MGLLLVALASAQFGSRSVLNPRTYVSPKGIARLWVNPDRPDGGGAATYRLTVGGKLRWTKVFPFTLSDVGVSDEGTAGGYGHGRGTFVVAIVRSDGMLALSEKYAIQPSRYPDGHANPHANGLVFDSLNDRMIVRVADPDINRNLETWWTYRLSTGERGVDRQPSPLEGCRWIVAARPVPETKLILLNWWRFDEKMGASFSLVDANARSVWRLDLPGDYELGGSEASQDTLREAMQTQGAILGVGPSRFVLRHVKAGLRVTYAIRDGKVEKTEQAPYVPPSVSAPLLEPAVPLGKLVVRGKTVLPLRPSGSPVHDVEEFFTLGEDRIVFLRGGDAPALVEVETQGRLRRSLPLGLGRYRENEDRHLAWTGGSRFVLVRSIEGSNAQSQAWRIDLDARRMTPLRAFRSNPVKAITGRSDGSFAVLSTERYPSSSSEELAFFDATGRRKWIHTTEGGYGGRPDEMLSPEDVEFDGQGRIVVLDNGAHLLQRFDISGRFLGNVDLKRSWKRDPSYLTNLSRDRKDGLLVIDSGAERPLLGLRTDGTIRSQWAPHLPNGKKIDLTQDPRVDAKGHVWITNRHALFRLDAQGAARRTLGPESDGVLREVGELFVAPSGAVYAMDAVDQSIHVFDSTGRRRFVARPRVGDFDERPGATLQVARSGDIYLEGAKNLSILHFSPTGRRLPDQPLRTRASEGPKPRTVPPTWRWRQRWRSGDLLDEQGHIVAQVQRWPNGDWLTDDQEFLAPDGRFVALDRRAPEGRPWRFAVYSASGLPQRMGRLPPGLNSFDAVAFDGETIYWTQGRELFALGMNGRPWGRFRLPGSEGQIFPTRDGFAWFDGVKTVFRFARPSR